MLCVLQVNGFPSAANPLGATLKARADTLFTAALRPFGSPCNLAVASPDGLWIAVCCDSQKIYIVETDGFSYREIPFAVIHPVSDADINSDIACGSQYVAWNSSSTLVAATSDILRAVFVWNVVSGDLVFREEGHRQACLPVVCAPWDDDLLIIADASKRINVIKLMTGQRDRNLHEGEISSRHDSKVHGLLTN